MDELQGTRSLSAGHQASVSAGQGTRPFYLQDTRSPFAGSAQQAARPYRGVDALGDLGSVLRVLPETEPKQKQQQQQPNTIRI